MLVLAYLWPLAAVPLLVSKDDAEVQWHAKHGLVLMAAELLAVLVLSILAGLMTMLAFGVFYVIQGAPFLGAVQIIVYTGAIMILFLFVLMLVGRDSSDSVVETLRGQRVAAIVLGIGVIVGSS